MQVERTSFPFFPTPPPLPLDRLLPRLDSGSDLSSATPRTQGPLSSGRDSSSDGEFTWRDVLECFVELLGTPSNPIEGLDPKNGMRLFRDQLNDYSGEQLLASALAMWLIFRHEQDPHNTKILWWFLSGIAMTFFKENKRVADLVGDSPLIDRWTSELSDFVDNEPTLSLPNGNERTLSLARQHLAKVISRLLETVETEEAIWRQRSSEPDLEVDVLIHWHALCRRLAPFLIGTRRPDPQIVGEITAHTRTMDAQSFLITNALLYHCYYFLACSPYERRPGEKPPSSLQEWMTRDHTQAFLLQATDVLDAEPQWIALQWFHLPYASLTTRAQATLHANDCSWLTICSPKGCASFRKLLALRPFPLSLCLTSLDAIRQNEHLSYLDKKLTSDAILEYGIPPKISILNVCFLLKVLTGLSSILLSEHYAMLLNRLMMKSWICSLPDSIMAKGSVENFLARDNKVFEESAEKLLTIMREAICCFDDGARANLMNQARFQSIQAFCGATTDGVEDVDILVFGYVRNALLATIYRLFQGIDDPILRKTVFDYLVEHAKKAKIEWLNMEGKTELPDAGAPASIVLRQLSFFNGSKIVIAVSGTLLIFGTPSTISRNWHALRNRREANYTAIYLADSTLGSL